MSLINQLSRQLTGLNIPCDLERCLIDYIKTFNANNKVFKLLNIIDCKFHDAFCRSLTDINVKQLNSVRREMNIRTCDIIGSGKNMNVRREDLIRGITGRYLDEKYEEKFNRFCDDNLFSNIKRFRYKKTRKFYKQYDMKENLDEFKQQFITDETNIAIDTIKAIQEKTGVRSNNAELYIKELKENDCYKNTRVFNEEKNSYKIVAKKRFPLRGRPCGKVKIYIPELYDTRWKCVDTYCYFYAQRERVEGYCAKYTGRFNCY